MHRLGGNGRRAAGRSSRRHSTATAASTSWSTTPATSGARSLKEMSLRGLRRRRRRASAGRLPRRAAGVSADVRRGLRPHRADLVDRRAVRQPRRRELRGGQGRRDRAVQRRRAGRRCRRREVQRHRARRRDENGRGHRIPRRIRRWVRSWWHRSSAGWRTNPVRSQARCSSPSPAGWPGPSSPRPPACTARRGRSRTSANRSTRSATPSDPLVFPVVPDGHGDHIRYSFGWRSRRERVMASHGPLTGCASSTSPRW